MIKSDGILGIVEDFDVLIIALQENKLNESTHLRTRGYHVLRLDRQYKGGGCLAFLVRKVKYQQIHHSLMTNSDLEMHDIRGSMGTSTLTSSLCTPS
ncbi:hypothetical protein NPIL_280321 [Nephila pilipes]|uniref:Uncharacterized protein n=1 Tax=Nephila pilipes TaxID=299642 RepID=A0A8X6ULK9_NEPPI|nr:hypothetical protein NPIL_280321 [Nephila pilipes]